MEGQLIHWKDLLDFAQEIMVRLKVSKEGAFVIADNLVASNLRGIDSHGVARLQRYVSGIQTGYIIPDAKPEMVTETDIFGNVDGHNGPGQVMANFAMEQAIQKAGKKGFGMVTVFNSNHFGFAAYYALMALKHNLIGVSMTNSAPLVVPTFGKNAIFGTNPIAVAVPAGERRPWVMDFATSVVPRGKLEVYNRLGESLPEGWATDERGHVNTDPARVLKNLGEQLGGGILPLGGAGELFSGHKGYGLAIMVDIFCGIMSGANFGPFLVSKKDGKTNFPRIGHFFMVIDPAVFMDIRTFRNRMDTYLEMLVNSQKAEGEERIYVHGEKEFEAEALRKKDGIPLDKKTVESLQKLSAEYDIKIKFKDK